MCGHEYVVRGTPRPVGIVLDSEPVRPRAGEGLPGPLRDVAVTSETPSRETGCRHDGCYPFLTTFHRLGEMGAVRAHLS